MGCCQKIPAGTAGRVSAASRAATRAATQAATAAAKAKAKGCPPGGCHGARAVFVPKKTQAKPTPAARVKPCECGQIQ